jgi:hypothetical protein
MMQRDLVGDMIIDRMRDAGQAAAFCLLATPVLLVGFCVFFPVYVISGAAYGVRWLVKGEGR